MQQDIFDPQKDYEKLISTDNCVFVSLVGASEVEKKQLVHNLVKIETFPPEFDKIHFFDNNSQPIHNVIQKKTESFEFFHSVTFELIDSLKNNGTKYLLIFDDSCSSWFKI